MTIISSLTVSKESDLKNFKLLKIKDAPIYRPLSILTNARTPQTKDDRILIDLLHNHELLTEILSKDNELEHLAQVAHYERELENF